MGKGSGVTFLAKGSVSYGPAALGSGCWALGPRLQPQRRQGCPARSRECVSLCLQGVRKGCPYCPRMGHHVATAH